MADGSVKIEINGDDSGFEKSLSGLDGKASKLASGGLKAVTAAVAAFGAAAASGAAACVAVGSQYESAFAQVSTIMDNTVMSYEDMSSSIIQLSNETGAAATDLSSAVYDAISATGDTANAVELVAQAQQLATAGFAESGDALSTLTTIMNAYGMSASEAASISDSLITVQNLGVTTIAELSGSMGKAIATAAAYGVNLSNLEASYISLTKAGISTEESTTYMSAMFKELGDSGSDVAEIIQNELGMSFGQAMSNGYSLADCLGIIMDACNGDTEALMNLWGSAEAGKAAAAIVSQGLEQFNDNLLTLESSAGATASAYEKMTSTFQYQTDLLKTRVSNLGTMIYQKFSGTAVNAVSKLADAMGELIDRMENGDLADEIDSIAEAFAGLIDGTANFISGALPSLIEGFTWVLQHAGAVAAEVGVLAAGFTALRVAVETAKLAETVPKFALISEAALSAAGPILAVGTAAIVAGVAFSEMVKWMQEDATGLGEHKEALAENKEQIEENTASVEELIEKYRELKDTISGNQTDVSGQITELNNLVAAYDGSASSAYAIQQAIESLNAAVPGLNASFDEQAGTLNKTAAEMQALNDQYAAQSAYDAAMAQKSATTEAYTAALEDQAAAQAELNALQAEFETWKGENPAAVAAGYEGSAAYAAWADSIGAAEANLAAANAEVMTAGHAMGEAMVDVANTANAYDEATDAVNGFAQAEETAAEKSSGLSEEQLATAKTMTDIKIAARNATGSAEELRAQYEELSAQYEELDTAGMEYAAGLVEQSLQQLNLRATTAELREGLGLLANQTDLDLSSVSARLIAAGVTAEEFAGNVTSALSEVVNGFEQYNLESQTSLEQANAALQYNTTAQANWVSNLSTLWNEAVSTGDTAAMAYIQSLEEMGIESATIVQELADDMANGGDAMAEASNAYAEATAAAAEQASLELSMQEGAMYEAGKAVGEQSAEGLAEGASEASTAGAEYDTEMATGITDNVGVVETAATTVANAAADAAGSVDFTSVGYYISAGIAAGIASGESMVTAAAVSVVQAAKAAADAEAAIASPSKLFRDEVGYWMSAGIAKGMEKGQPLVTKQARDIVRQAKEATTATVDSIGTGSGAAAVYNYFNDGGQTRAAVRDNLIKLAVNGREFARATASTLWDQFEYVLA